MQSNSSSSWNYSTLSDSWRMFRVCVCVCVCVCLYIYISPIEYSIGVWAVISSESISVSLGISSPLISPPVIYFLAEKLIGCSCQKTIGVGHYFIGQSVDKILLMKHQQTNHMWYKSCISNKLTDRIIDILYRWICWFISKYFTTLCNSIRKIGLFYW